MMSRLFIGNFSFEQNWDPGKNPTRQVLRLEAELACVWLAVARDGDEILCPVAIEEEYWGRMRQLGCAEVTPRLAAEIRQTRATELVPWGWTPEMRRLAAQLKLKIRAPEQSAIWQANSREFAYQLCQQAECTLPSECIVRNISEALERIAVLQNSARAWLIKPNQGQSGRGQLRGTDLPAGKTLATLERMLQQQGCVQIEPFLDRIGELSGQWEIPVDREPQFLALTELHTDFRGVYQGSCLNRLVLSSSARDNLLRAQLAVVQGLQGIGYFGPVGIDAMLFRGENGIGVRPVQDINARWTMGRIAWEWSRVMGRRERKMDAMGVWWQSPTAPAASAISLSPESMDGQPVKNRTWWLGEHAAAQFLNFTDP